MAPRRPRVNVTVNAARRRAAPKRRGPPQKRAGGMRSNAAQVLAPGVGAITRRPFGSVPGHTLAVWDAKLPQHLPLPRAVGPYTVIRMTKRFNTDTKCVVIAPFQEHGSTATSAGWTNICAMGAVDSSLPINAVNNAQQWVFDISGFGVAATIVPSAVSLQLMNANPLQSTAGVIYAGVMPTQAAVGGAPGTWLTRFDNFVEYQAPRLMSAPKLALKGIQINSYPLNMTACSDFTVLEPHPDGAITWDGDIQPVGFAPIMVYNAGEPGTRPSLEYLVTMEFRVRFDFTNVQSATHTHHEVASDSVWNGLMRKAAAIGNGVVDISDVIAAAGQTARAIRGNASYMRPIMVD